MTKTKWYHFFITDDEKVAVVTIGFLLWMIALTTCWTYLTIRHEKLEDLPRAVVHLTIALGATKVTHKLAEQDWSKVAEKLIDCIYLRKIEKIQQKG